MQLPEWSNGIGKHIVKVEDGKSVVGTFRGELVRFYSHWFNGRGSICQGRETCQLCNGENEEARKATGRFRINFIVRDQMGKLTPMILEGGRRVFDQLAQINRDIPLEKAWVRVSRTGSKQNTQYMLQVVPGDGGIVKPNDEKEILKVRLHDLSLRKEDDEEEREPGSDG